jgi:hypothetical protein
MMKNAFFVWLCAASVVLIHVGCGEGVREVSEDTSADASADADMMSPVSPTCEVRQLRRMLQPPLCGQAGRTGETSCASAMSGACMVSQFCDELRGCEQGCLTDNNCGANQYCDIPVHGNGTCRNCLRLQPMPSPPPPRSPNSDCEDTAQELRVCRLLSISEAAMYITACSDPEDEEDRQLFSEFRTCVNLAVGNCEEMKECIEDVLGIPREPSTPREPSAPPDECEARL